jgi:hypothetical protein
MPVDLRAGKTRGMAVSEVDQPVTRPPRRRQRRPWIVLTVVIAVIALVAWLIDEADVIPRVEFAVGGSMATTTVARGGNDGYAWELDVFYQDGDLCMFLDPPGTGTEHTYGGSCWNSDQDQDSGEFFPFSGPNNKASNLSMVFGAIPAGAVAMRVAQHVVVAGRPMPHPFGNHPTQFFLWIVPDGPTAATGAILSSPIPLDASGHVVPIPTVGACPGCPSPAIGPS